MHWGSVAQKKIKMLNSDQLILALIWLGFKLEVLLQNLIPTETIIRIEL